MNGSKPQRPPMLYVDDSASDRALVAHLWSEVSDAPLVALEGGEDLLDYVERCAVGEEVWPALCLLDLNMAPMNGLETLDAIGDRGRSCPFPIVVFSTSSRPEDARDCMTHGARGYLVKEIDLKGLRRTLAACHGFWIDLVEPPPSNGLAGNEGSSTAD